MNRSHSFQNLLDNVLAPEVEAGPFGAPPLGTDPMPERRDPEARLLFRGCLIIFCIFGLAAITLRDAEVRHSMPPAPAVAVEPSAGSALAVARQLQPGQSYCIQDLREGDCYWCAHRTDSGDTVGGYAC